MPRCTSPLRSILHLVPAWRFLPYYSRGAIRDRLQCSVVARLLQRYRWYGRAIMIVAELARIRVVVHDELIESVDLNSHLNLH
ncbi:hypothetical protein RHA1_ro08914 (plasmid) [Rhodococcus jostii RHA1]|uniref:Uncharacterized protein n=1 Tax=Rhodococcus jostii (strain RHA1) TaxID=101510 RepID=Q0RXM8_RHOJR|nr:hypothetical protein RHA1_ro08914 [Rhodococcus jostii RHA1]